MTEETKNKFSGKYVSAIGRRKTAVAQVRLFKNGKGVIVINDKKLTDYFPSENEQKIINMPLKAAGVEKGVDFSILIKGGGKQGQAEAVRHGISRALLIMDKELKSTLKAEKLLTRDARKKERKKPGLKKARKRPQWSKR